MIIFSFVSPDVRDKFRKGASEKGMELNDHLEEALLGKDAVVGSHTAGQRPSHPFSMGEKTITLAVAHLCQHYWLL